MEPTPETGSRPVDVLAYAAELTQAEVPFVLATVVWSQKPTSARPGAKAVVTAEGAFFGWVGGSCAQPTVMREALRALVDGEPRLLRLDPEATVETRAGVIVAPLTCHSGGKLEVFLEPVLPRLQLLVFGESPVADALIRLGQGMGYRVVAVRPGGPASAPAETDQLVGSFEVGAATAGRRCAAVVASMGVYDEEAVAAALRSGCGYVGLVASRRRAASLREQLAEDGIPAERLALLKAPAGLDIDAELPEEIALSILAEIVSRRRSLAVAQPEQPPAAAAESAIDPVCGMKVEIAAARHSYDYAGRRYYFCCPACRKAFAAEPERYLTSAGAS